MVKMEPLASALSLLFLLSFTNFCVGDTSRETVVFFEDGKAHITNIPHEKQPTRSTLYAFTAPAFVGGLFNHKEYLAMISIAEWSASSNTKYMSAVFRQTYGRNYKDLGYVKALIQPTEVKPSFAFWGDVTAVMKGNKIYVLTTTWDTTNQVNKEQMGNIVRDPFMSVGTIVSFPDFDGNDNAYIREWTVQSIKNQVPTTVHETNGSNFIGGTGNGIVTTNGTIMFPIVMFIKNETVSSTLYSINDGKTWNIGGATEKDTTAGSLVEWNDGKLLLTAWSEYGYRKVFESNDMGVTWKQSPVFFAVWSNNLYSNSTGHQGSAITVPVDKINVLLFLHTMTEEKNKIVIADNLQLWLSDGQRIMCLGTISHTKKAEENSGNSTLVYVDEHLFVTQQTNPLGDTQQETSNTQKDRSSVIGFTPLPDFLKNVQTAVRDWRNLDKRYQSMGIPTNGLVGVLGNTQTEDNGVWADMYNCVNAKVYNGEKVDGGFRFNGASSNGVEWPVINQGDNQRYIFTEKEFTITANITIHSTSEAEDIPLMGAYSASNSRSVLIGLGYTKEKKWYITRESDDNINTEVTVEINKEYEVAITYSNGQGAVYVSGVNIAKQTIPITTSMFIYYFFIGSLGLSSQSANGHSCTVKSVMLFNRALPESEIAQFGKIKISDEKEKQTQTTTEEHVPENQAGSSKDKSPSARENIQSVQDTKSEREQKILRTTSSTKITREQENRPAELENTFTSARENTNTAPSKETKGGSVMVLKNVTITKNSDKKMLKSLQQHKHNVFPQDDESDNGSALQFSFVACMCFVWSFVVMTVF